LQQSSTNIFHIQRGENSVRPFAPAGNLTGKHPLIVAAIALGAFLTFLVQPLAARSLLPTFGGSGSVWVTALVFYQVILAAGYVLSHFIHTRLTINGQKITLFLLSVGTLLTLSILPKPIAVSDNLPAMQLLLSLVISVGPPLLVLAVAGPLVQGWVATQSDATASSRDIYSLYAISNGASLLALAGYPFVVEPIWGIQKQGQIWEGLFAVEVLLLIVIAILVRASSHSVPSREKSCNTSTRTNQNAGRKRTLLWLCWSAAGVMVLTSTSGYIGQEIAAIPMLWVLPLSLYLVTWILAFSGMGHPGVLVRGFLALVALVLIFLAVDFRLISDWGVKLICALAAMTLACLTVHTSLYQLRPEKGQLTGFYAAVAIGGAIGGIFSGVVAIQLFQDWRDLALAFNLVALLACGALVPHLRVPKIILLPREFSFWLANLLLVSCCFLFVVTGMERPGLLYKHRDFHGLVRVVEEDADNSQRHRLVMFHGATVHGSQFMDPKLRATPTTYFGHGTGGEIAVKAQRALAGGRHGLNIGVVGLGVGTMAAHLHEHDAMCFYELSPVVADLAQASEPLGNSGCHFSYLSDAAGETNIVVGDARLSLAAELIEKPKGNSYDLLVLDAFAGDAVPFHLLTQEAFSLFTKHLSDTGMIAVHISSNWLDLLPVVYAWADTERWQALAISTMGDSDGITGNHALWVVMFRDEGMLQILADQCKPLMAKGKITTQNMRNINYGNLKPWTDDQSDMLTLMQSDIRLRDGVGKSQ
jgi:spermidine synthase